jgi:hypothetical protein
VPIASATYLNPLPLVSPALTASAHLGILKRFRMCWSYDWQQDLAAHSTGFPSKRSRDAGETIASAFATPPAWGGYAGRNFETELASFLVPGFPVPDRHEAQSRA